MKRPDKNVIVVGPVKGWWATWRGGEYIDVYGSKQDAAADARGENVGAVHAINTTGDTIGDDRAAYVKAELTAWADEDGGDYRANGY